MYLLEGLILTILAADMSGIRGRWAKELQLPFGSLAESIWVVVPIIFIGMSIPAFRRKLGRHQHWLHGIAIACVLMPIVTFTQQSQKIALLDFPSTEASAAIREHYNGRILFVSSSGDGTNAFIPRSLDRGEVAQKIFSLDPSVNPTSAEQDGAGQAQTRLESK